MEQGICYVIITVLVGYIGCMGLSNLDVFKCHVPREKGTVLSCFSTDATTIDLKVVFGKADARRSYNKSLRLAPPRG